MTDKPTRADMDAPETDELTQIIKDRAHQLWESEGSAEGRLDEYWHRARELIQSEAEASYPPAASRGHRT